MSGPQGHSSAGLVVVDDFDAADTGAPALLITGMPGAGKTNYVISEFAIGKRDVYQCNIPGCTLPSFDPLKWPDELASMKVDATLIFDECREVFPPRNPSADPPPHYVLNRIRHTGRRVVIMAQHPNDIDARVRRLCSRHIHLVEAFGGGAAKVYEWRGKIGDVDGTKADAIEGKYAWNQKAFKFYKSTEMHRGSAPVPARIRRIKWIAGGAIVAAVVGLGVAYQSMKGVTPAAGNLGTARIVPTKQIESRDRHLTPKEYVDSFAPRIAGLSYSAPRYDDITKPVRAPVPAACVESKSNGCKCYTQQATPLAVEPSVCKQFVAGGVFVDFEPEGKGAAQPPQAPVAAPQPVPGGQVALAGSFGAPAAATAVAQADAEVMNPGRGRNLPPLRPPTLPR